MSTTRQISNAMLQNDPADVESALQKSSTSNSTTKVNNATTVAPTNSLMQLKCQRYYDNINHLCQEGFEQVVQRPYQANSTDSKVKPSRDYDAFTSDNDVAMYDKSSRRLFLKNGQLYELSFRSLTLKTHPLPTLLYATDDQGKKLETINYVFIIVVKQKTNTDDKVYELRVLPNTENAHAYLFNSSKKDEHSEGASTLVAAGTFSVCDGRIFFATDQTGHFYDYLKDYKKEYREIFELFFPPSLSYTYYYLRDLKPGETNAIYPGVVAAERDEAFKQFKKSQRHAMNEACETTNASSEIESSQFESNANQLFASSKVKSDFESQLNVAPSNTFTSKP